jgi:hypothetical protein
MTAQRTVSIIGTSSLTPPASAAYARGAAVIRVGFQPSADENADAVMAALVEGGISVKKALQVLLAVAAGTTNINVSGANPIVTFRNTDGTVDRVTATMDGSERTTTVIN